MQSKIPFFSVVIPTYNRSHKIFDCINSVLNQDFKDYEIVIVDNGSTDGTEELLKKNISSNRLRYFWQEGSGSPAKPRNQGIIKSRGEWISFLDSDDRWYPDKLECTYDHIQMNAAADVVCHHERLVTPCSTERNKILRHGRKTNNMYQSLLMDGNCLSPSATSIKRMLLINNGLFFNESQDYVIVEDYDLWLRIAKEGAQFTFLNRCLGDYIMDDENMISDWQTYMMNLGNLYHYHAYFVQDHEPNRKKLFSRLQARIQFEKLRNAWRGKNYKSAVRQCNSFLMEFPAFFPRKIFQKAVSVLK